MENLSGGFYVPGLKMAILFLLILASLVAQQVKD